MFFREPKCFFFCSREELFIYSFLYKSVEFKGSFAAGKSLLLWKVSAFVRRRAFHTYNESKQIRNSLIRAGVFGSFAHTFTHTATHTHQQQ